MSKQISTRIVARVSVIKFAAFFVLLSLTIHQSSAFIAPQPTTQRDNGNFHFPALEATRSSNQFARKKEQKWKWKLIKPVEQVENELTAALDTLQEWKRKNDEELSTFTNFPSIRECNAALALLGDDRQFLRALRLFGKLRKAATLYPRLQPTLVTYSTLMSRFVKADKPAVALRLWKMRTDNNNNNTIEHIDVKACNILMNCHAKLADVQSATALLNDMKSSTMQLPPPNRITYNTFLSACQKAGDLDAALHCLYHDAFAADTLTYTTLIATVARRATRAAGRHDPTLAFSLYQDMLTLQVPANGKTFSALIDCCNRCKRSDLALQGLRLMLSHKRRLGVEQLTHEVGAWTAAIHGAGSLELARKLFDTMVRHGVAPNTVTCGSLTDRLLKAGMTEAAVEVLRLMKDEKIGVSKVMVTSLLTRAQELAETELSKESGASDGLDPNSVNQVNRTTTKAIEIYTELLESLLTDQVHSQPSEKGRKRKQSQLLVVRAFLLFQEIRSTGIDLDLGCYHAMLRVCSRAKDSVHAETVVRKMLGDSNVAPTDATWKLFLRSAGNDVATVERIWKEFAIAFRNKRAPTGQQLWAPSLDSFRILLDVFAKGQDSDSVLGLVRAVKNGEDWRGFGTDRIAYADLQNDVKVENIVREAVEATGRQSPAPYTGVSSIK